MLKFLSKNGNHGGYEIHMRLWIAAVTLIFLILVTFASVLGAFYTLSGRVDRSHLVDENIIEDVKSIKASQSQWIDALQKIEIHLGKIDTKLEMMEKQSTK